MISRISKLLSLLFFLGCTDTVDLKPVDQLIRQKGFIKALELIEKYEKQTEMDSLTIKRVNHRKVLAEKGVLFLTLDSMFVRSDTIELETQLQSIEKIIRSKDSLKARWYFFDYYKSKAKYKLLLTDTSAWLSNIEKAVSFPSSDVSAKSDLFIDVAFYFAQKKQFVNAREQLDNAIKRFDISEKGSKFNDVFAYYMNGKFKQADSILTKIGDLTTKPRWQKVQNFLNLYADSLSMENRFRLW